MLTPNSLRQKYFDFFSDKIRQHVVIPSAPLVPENDPTTLFTGSGMQPLINYFLGEPHPKGTRVVDSQKCLRAEDVEEVGDNRHTTFFEMLGNWSFGDYFKQEQLSWFFEFLTKVVGLDPQKLYVTTFTGSKKYGIERDEETVKIWQELFAKHGIEAKTIDDAEQKGLQEGRIFYYLWENWWSRAGEPANMPVDEPGGPDSEVFYDFGPEIKCHENSPFKDQPCHVNCDCGRFLEIGNSVFMQYKRTKDGFEPLPKKNVDFGGGFLRILAAEAGDPDVFKTASFQPLIKVVEALAKIDYQQAQFEEKRSMRVIADHLRSAVMLTADGVWPSNKEQGYITRRLIRRAIRYGKMIGIEENFLPAIVPVVVKIYQDAYPEVKAQAEQIESALEEEEQKFRQTLGKGLREFDKAVQAQQELTGELAFKLYETYGFPLELSLEEAQSRKLKVADQIEQVFIQAKARHQEKSRTASAGMFKGGLADESDTTTQYHTATHLLHTALRQVLGNHVEQKGSNINGKRLRFDFTHPQAMTDQEKQQVTKLINDWIKEDLPVFAKTMKKKEALDSGALAFFAQRYPDEVTVYIIGKDPQGEAGKGWISRELCGGPHVASTGQISELEFFKEKSAAAGVRRVYMRLKE